jgi:hypothetical protein
LYETFERFKSADRREESEVGVNTVALLRLSRIESASSTT